MLLHALQHFPADPHADFSWWLIHVETLTPVHLHSSGRRIQVQIVRPPAATPPAIRSHSAVAFDPQAIATEISREIRTTFDLHRAFNSYALRDRNEIEVPEYLLTFDIQGVHPAIVRTHDPSMILPVGEQAPTPSQFIAWSTATDLSAEGWAYWWEDCMRAYDRLSDELLQPERGL